MKCEGCNAETSMGVIKNYVVRYSSWEAFNCCCEDCARASANSNGISNDEIEDIE